nr:hypothetical protein GCM10025699_52000 [Microbacterium flavescens]
MSESVNLPALGESVTEGTVTRWLKNVGDRVEVDEPLLEVSTDKVDTEIPSPVAGVIEEILVPEDETVEVGTALVRIGDGSSSDSGEPAADEQAESPAEAPSEPEAEEAEVPSSAAPAPGEESAETAPEPAPAADPAPAAPRPQRLRQPPRPLPPRRHRLPLPPRPRLPPHPQPRPPPRRLRRRTPVRWRVT